MNKVLNGIISSLIGGIVFGVLMTMMGMMSMIAGMVGSTSIAVGWIIHLMISGVFGLIFGLIVGDKKQPIGLGVIYGFVLWFLFPFILMPLMMGGSPFQFNFMSLMGHLIYGVILGFSYKVFNKQNVSETRTLE